MRPCFFRKIFAAATLIFAAATPAFAVDYVPPKSDKPLTVMEAVRAGKAALEGILEERLARETQPYPVELDTPARVTFAVWDRDTDEITITHGIKNGRSLEITTEPKLPIKVIYTNRVYSRYSVGDNKVVVGVIYPSIETVGKGKSATHNAIDVIYVPYSSHFYTPEVHRAGSDYLSYLVQDAYDELRAKGIKSKAFRDRLVADVIDPHLVKSIAVIEQSGAATLLGNVEPERAIGRFLVNLATNEGAAFGNVRSRAGAVGMVQFIPSTYALMVNKRPDLGLIPDFAAGMANHQNAVKAQIAYLDEELAIVPSVARQLLDTDKVAAGTFMAAAYNGGSWRVRQAYKTYGDAWQSLHRWNGYLARSSLRGETVTYLKKLKATYSMFAAGYFATPSAPNGGLPTSDRATAIAQLRDVVINMPTSKAPPLSLASSSSTVQGDELSALNKATSPNRAPATAQAIPTNRLATNSNLICFSDGGCFRMK